MDIAVTIALYTVAAVASAQIPTSPGRTAATLVFPFAGAPLSLEQLEERTHTLPGGTSTEITKIKVYRDSAGRVRTESSVQRASGEALVTAHIVDPVAGTMVLLLAWAKVAVITLMPESQARAYRSSATRDRAPQDTRTKGTEDLGISIIEGVQVFGARFTPPSGIRTPIFTMQESWWSPDLQMKVSETTTRPNGKDVVKIQKLVRGEPDPALFKIPGDYTIQDVP